jgi:polysaccharide export outer membrane protein
MMSHPRILTLVVLTGITLQSASAVAQGTRSAAPQAAARPAEATAAAPAAPRPVATTGTTSRPWHEQEYRLGAGDKLRIEVYKQDQLSQSLQIRPDGKITLPFIGDVAAAGKTSVELRDSLTTALKEYVTNPVVTVMVQEATSAQVHVIGEVEHPGTQVMAGPRTVLQALAEAGGLTEFADRGGVHVLRNTSTGMQNIPFAYKDALKGRVEPLYLQPGDTVVVP